MTVNKERLRLGIEALRSGEFEQTTGNLRAGSLTSKNNYGYCCLGVLTEVAMRNGCQLDAKEVARLADYTNHDPAEYVWFLDNDELLPPVVRDWYGLDRNPTLAVIEEAGEITATMANDDQRWDFNKIADLFEERYINEPDDDARPAV